MVATTDTHLIDGEVFTSNYKNDEEQITPPDTEIDKKYRRGEMRIITEQGRINLHAIVATLDSKQGGKSKYILNPVYQRRKRWDNRKKSLLIESFIINVPIPPIYLYEVEYAVYEVMDGLQRLTTIYDFYKGNFALEGLEYWQELNGKTYQQLPRNIKAGIDRRYLSSIVLLAETSKKIEDAEFLKRLVFERLNNGGSKLTAQETRNALYSGKFNELCLKLAEYENFRKLWHFPLMSANEEELLKNDPYREMQDVELVLRFFAYRHIDKLTSPIDKFLDSFLKQANHYPNYTLLKLEKLFIQTIDTIYNTLGKNAFTMPKHKTPTKTIYDSIMQTFANNIEHHNTFIENKKSIKKDLYKNLSSFNHKNDQPLFDGRLNNKKHIIRRIEYFHDYLQSHIS